MKTTSNGTPHDDLLVTLTMVADHLAQYRAYAEEMRAIGRGMHPSSPYSPEYLAGMVAQEIERAEARS